MNKISAFFKEQPVLKIIYILLAAAAASGYVEAPYALAGGLVFALIFGNPMKKQTTSASKHLLRWSIVGLGFGMNITAVADAGMNGLGFTIATIVGTLFFGFMIGKMLKIEPNTSTLISSGTAICGGSAIAAIGPVIGADSKSMSVSLITIFILNAIALFVFPHLGTFFELTQEQFGIWCAIAIHDTSSVVGASSKYGDEALKIATTVKLTRALWIIPLAVTLAFLKKGKNKKIQIPWFILFFILASIITTLLPQGEEVYKWIKVIAKHGLVLTLFLIGSSLTRDDIKTVGFKPMIQGIILWIIISVSSLLAVMSILKT
jgi:uncharacterized integral membrane protein (TIGR00698 family)